MPDLALPQFRERCQVQQDRERPRNAGIITRGKAATTVFGLSRDRIWIGEGELRNELTLLQALDTVPGITQKRLSALLETTAPP